MSNKSVSVYLDALKRQQEETQQPADNEHSENNTLSQANKIPIFVSKANDPKQASERTEKRSEKRTVSLPVKRPTKRYSFEFYIDQITTLRRLKREAEDRGEQLSLSDIAREAFDVYLRKKR